MHRAGILGYHSSRKFFTPQPTPFLSDLKSAPPAGPSPPSRVINHADVLPRNPGCHLGSHALDHYKARYSH